MKVICIKFDISIMQLACIGLCMYPNIFLVLTRHKYLLICLIKRFLIIYYIVSCIHADQTFNQNDICDVESMQIAFEQRGLPFPNQVSRGTD